MESRSTSSDGEPQQPQGTATATPTATPSLEPAEYGAGVAGHDAPLPQIPPPGSGPHARLGFLLGVSRARPTPSSSTGMQGGGQRAGLPPVAGSSRKRRAPTHPVQSDAHACTEGEERRRQADREGQVTRARFCKL